MQETFGYQTKRVPMYLGTGDFLADVKTTSPMPAGSTASLLLANGVTFPGTLNTLRTMFSWRVESTEVTAVKIPEGTAYKVVVSMPRVGVAGTDDVPVLFGTVTRND